jgi:hypothetical protein
MAACTALPALAQPVGAQTRLSTTGADGDATFDASGAALAENARTGQALVVWAGDVTSGEAEIFGRLLDAQGTPVGAQVRLSDMGPEGNVAFDAAAPAVAYNPRANEFLVAWQGDDTTDEEYEIHAQRVSAAGAELGTNDQRVSDLGPDASALFQALEPSVAYSRQADEYLVAFAGDDNTAPLVDDELEIFAQRLNGAGAEVGTNDQRISDMGPDGNAAFDASAPDVSHNLQTNEYVVAWQGDDTTDEETEIHVQRVGAVGAEVGTNDQRISDLGPDGSALFQASRPAVAYNERENEMLVAFAGDDNTAPLVDDELEIFAQRLNGAGAEVGTNDQRISDIGPDGNAAFDAMAPDAAYDRRASEYLVAWQGDDGAAGLVDDEVEVYEQRLGSTGAEIGDNDVRVSTISPDGSAAFGAASPAATFTASANEYAVAFDADQGTVPLVDEEREVYARRVSAATAPTPAAAVCRSVSAPTAPPGNPSAIRLSREQLLINQRISQAAVRRANAVQAWLAAGVEGRDICGGALTAPDFAQGTVTSFTAVPVTPAAPTPRAVTPAGQRQGNAAGVRLSREQLLINQRISQAAVRRMNALKARLDGGLTGGDVDNGTIARPQLSAGIEILVAPRPATPPARTTTNVAPFRANNPGGVRLTRGQLLVNQRISQAAVRRSNDLIARLGRGLGAGDIRNGTLTGFDLANGVALASQ